MYIVSVFLHMLFLEIDFQPFPKTYEHLQIQGNLRIQPGQTVFHSLNLWFVMCLMSIVLITLNAQEFSYESPNCVPLVISPNSALCSGYWHDWFLLYLYKTLDAFKKTHLIDIGCLVPIVESFYLLH